MPCTYESTDESLSRANRTINNLTVMLCDALEYIPSEDQTDDQKAWKITHDLHDESRIRSEAANKLNERERRTLGIDCRGNKT